MTYSDLSNEAVNILMKNHIEEAKTDVFILFDKLLGKDRNFMLTHGDESINDEDISLINDAINKRSKHIPLQHITGEADFMGLVFSVNENVLIPRFDTECLVEEVMRECCDGAKVLDVCTGSGCILLSLMHYKNDIEGYATDISEKALAVAKMNAEKLGKNVTFIQSDLFNNIEEVGFDYILSNPPYIRTKDIEDLMEEVKNHDPMLALDGGVDGLDFYRRLAADAKSHLKISGKIFMEIGCDQGADVKNIFESAGYSDIQVIKDYCGNDRVVVARK